MQNFMNLKDTVTLLKKLKEIYFISKVDIGALEPLLYKDGKYDIIDLVLAIESMDLKVNLTTNGALLKKFSTRFQSTKINKIRISLHSLDEDYFNNMSSSKNFSAVFDSIKIAKKKNLPIELNSLMLKGFEDKTIDVVNFAEQNRLKLKIYNLYYAPYYKDDYNKYYLSSEEIIMFLKSKFSKFNLKQIVSDTKRNRVVFSSENTEFIVKEDKVLNRDNKYCQNCNFINDCGEQFGEYLRVNPDLKFYPCYLRKDLQFDLHNEEVLHSLYNFTNKINIRLIVSSLCNFKCVFPDNKRSFWCLKQGGDYKWK
jgi:molybdenum cofactor biosynthesis enzyme MoaA